MHLLRLRICLAPTPNLKILNLKIGRKWPISIFEHIFELQHRSDKVEDGSSFFRRRKNKEPHLRRISPSSKKPPWPSSVRSSDQYSEPRSKMEPGSSVFAAEDRRLKMRDGFFVLRLRFRRSRMQERFFVRNRRSKIGEGFVEQGKNLLRRWGEGVTYSIFGSKNKQQSPILVLRIRRTKNPSPHLRSRTKITRKITNAWVIDFRCRRRKIDGGDRLPSDWNKYRSWVVGRRFPPSQEPKTKESTLSDGKISPPSENVHIHANGKNRISYPLHLNRSSPKPGHTTGGSGRGGARRGGGEERGRTGREQTAGRFTQESLPGSRI